MEDLKVVKFGRLTLIEFSHKGKNGEHFWHVICDCGTKAVKRLSSMKRGETSSCGCLNLDKLKARAKHGQSGTRLHAIWKGIRTRCSNPNRRNAKDYILRGITLCPEWDDFKVFYDWAIDNGHKDDLSIDRIDNDKGYSPDNCRWVSSQVQSRNTRNNRWIEINGKNKVLSEWCELYKISHSTVLQREKRGMNIIEAITTPVKQ